jgi:hypothetical protein
VILDVPFVVVTTTRTEPEKFEILGVVPVLERSLKFVISATIEAGIVPEAAAFAGFKTVSVGTVAIIIATRKRTNTKVLPIIFCFCRTTMNPNLP